MYSFQLTFTWKFPTSNSVLNFPQKKSQYLINSRRDIYEFITPVSLLCFHEQKFILFFLVEEPNLLIIAKFTTQEDTP